MNVIANLFARLSSQRIGVMMGIFCLVAVAPVHAQEPVKFSPPDLSDTDSCISQNFGDTEAAKKCFPITVSICQQSSDKAAAVPAEADDTCRADAHSFWQEAFDDEQSSMGSNAATQMFAQMGSAIENMCSPLDEEPQERCYIQAYMMGAIELRIIRVWFAGKLAG